MKGGYGTLLGGPKRVSKAGVSLLKDKAYLLFFLLVNMVGRAYLAHETSYNPQPSR